MHLEFAGCLICTAPLSGRVAALVLPQPQSGILDPGQADFHPVYRGSAPDLAWHRPQDAASLLISDC